MINFKKTKEFLLSLFFTNRCRLCQAVCDIRSELCENCEINLPTIDGEICLSCGKEKDLCQCNGKAMFYFSVCAPYYYKDGPKKATVLLKYEPNPYIIQRLSGDMAKTVEERYAGYDFDCITYVPAHIKDEKSRGYNQARLLAEALGKKLNLPVFALLVKTFETEPQHKLSQTGRSGNLLGVFEMNEDCSADIEGTRILLCDDIKTTGSTLDECAKTLLINGCAEVRCITACLTE